MGDARAAEGAEPMTRGEGDVMRVGDTPPKSNAEERVRGLMDALESAVRLHRDKFPIRQASAKGVPKPQTSIERRCAKCLASFLGLAPGKTGERGLWRDWRWYCSQECFDA